jgi:hypothetical protein
VNELFSSHSSAAVLTTSVQGFVLDYFFSFTEIGIEKMEGK